jgi:hypothetical protein
MLLGDQQPPDISVEQRASSELVKLIRKLRWIGMEREAERLQTVLRRTPAADSVLAAPHDTD